MILNEPVIWLIALLLIFFYIAAPLYVRFGMRHSANPSFGRLELEQLDPQVAEFLKSHTLELLNLGFDEPTLVHIPDASSYVTSYLILLINRQSGDKAMVTAMMPRRIVLSIRFSISNSVLASKMAKFLTRLMAANSSIRRIQKRFALKYLN